MSNDKVKNLVTNINNSTFNNNISLINFTSNNSLLNDKSSNFLFLGIIFLLIVILIISILILIFLFKKKKRINVVNNIDLNRIIIKNPSNNNPQVIVNQKGGFQKVQNTSKVSDIIQPNNVLNEIKSHNLKDEIHKIINTSSSSGSMGVGKGKRSKRKRGNNSNLNNSGNSSGKEKGEIGKDNNLIDKEEKKENIMEINTQELEKEIKEQIKKYVVEDNI